MTNIAPNFDILINNKPLSQKARINIQSLQLVESITNTAKVQFIISDYDGFDLNLYTPQLKNSIHVKMGYGNELSSMFEGEIVNINPIYSSKETSTLEIIAMDRSYLLKKKQIPMMYSGNKFPNILSIIKYIVNKYNDPIQLRLFVSPESTLRNYTLTDDQAIEQTSETDWQMLDKIRKIGNYRLFVYSRTLSMVDTTWLLNNQSIKYTFEHRPTQQKVASGLVIPLKSFKPSLGVQDQREKVSIIWWKAVTKNNTSELKTDTVDTEGDIGYVDIRFGTSGFNTNLETIRVKENVKNDSQAKAIVEAELQSRAEKIVQGEGTIQGNPHLRIGQKHKFILNDIPGINRQYSGDYHITEVSHTYTLKEGYVTGFKVRRSGLSTMLITSREQ